MIDERALIARLEAADTQKLAQLLTRPTAAEEAVYRTYLGDAAYERMHALALRHGLRRGGTKGNVVLIHGIMGSDLTSFRRSDGDAEHVWVNYWRMIWGAMGRTRLGEDGTTETDPVYEVRATALMKRYYGETLLSLGRNWNVRPFFFDWRKDLARAAVDLEAMIGNQFDGQPVHIVAHSMGGLAARTFIQRYPARWKAMKGRLIMLGTPNHGSFAVPQIITGLEEMVRKVEWLDVTHDLPELLSILNTFVGTYQMLPSPLEMPSVAPLYRAETYPGFNIPQDRLDRALEHHRLLRGVVDVDRMVYVAGYDQKTWSDVRDLSKVADVASYEATLDGDGRVTHRLGLLADEDGKPVPTYYVRDSHGVLQLNQTVLMALDDLLETGQTSQLTTRLPAGRSATKEDPRKVARGLRDEQDHRVRQFVERVSRERSAVSAGIPPRVTRDARRIEQELTRGFLGTGDDGQDATPPRVPPDPVEIELAVLCGELQSCHEERLPIPIDALSVGHYVGVLPQNAELALDRAISETLQKDGTDRSRAKPPRKRQKSCSDGLVLTQYADRGVIRGELGQPFILPDPRNGRDGDPNRVIAIAGMGLPGRCGAPELSVVVRELCWSLGRFGKKHLATVLIGSGRHNLSVPEALDVWVEGLGAALTGVPPHQRLKRVTFVECDPERLPELRKAVGDICERSRRSPGGLLVHSAKDGGKHATRTGKKMSTPSPDSSDGIADTNPVPSRLTLTRDTDGYRFGAITPTAAVPERVVPLDQRLVDQANDELAGETVPAMQVERGRFLQTLLMPADLRPVLFTAEPLVMMLDAATARVHWEMLAQSDNGTATPPGPRPSNDAMPQQFLGTCRGLTRQLRTLFAPPPEPPPPPKRVLRVLVVADPAADAHLPGAELEGAEVADLFDAYNRLASPLSGNHIEVVRLLGPYQATRTNVLRELMTRSYDVLHFAGHCFYDRQKPSASGWVFGRDAFLTARELTRIDRVPSFVFSNACESGVTPDRAAMRSPELAPSFAEAFFARGVTNFVCTAWPVDDTAARVFALTLYRVLLGLPEGGPAPDNSDEPAAPAGAQGPRPMHKAMQTARRLLAGSTFGVGCWGAYQHYGNPYFHLLAPTTGT